MSKISIFILGIFSLGIIFHSQAQIRVETEQYTLPVLTQKSTNQILRIRLIRTDKKPYTLKSICLSFDGTTNLNDIENVSFYEEGKYRLLDPKKQLADIAKPKFTMKLKSNYLINQDTLTAWVSVKLNPKTNLSHCISVKCIDIQTSYGKSTPVVLSQREHLKIAVALRQKWQDSIHTSRIPGLATSKKGTLLAIYDGRRTTDDDLQGDIDICLDRSLDGGQTWEPTQVIIDMGKYGGLPEKYNGVSDPSILVDDNTGDIYVIGLWMHGVLDSKTGQWIEGLTDTSTVWNHQWRSHGSQPGFGIKQSAQFMMSKSSDDGVTWSKPINLTRQVKQQKWWLMAPGPGRGITTDDGTLVFATEGRDETGMQFSTITWSKDHGQTWHTGTPAYYNTNECMAVELSDHSIMLNMRERTNRGKQNDNGRAVAVTKDLGQTWTKHSTSQNTLIESACQASLYKHKYIDSLGVQRSVLLFFNPSSKTTRNNMTLKVSFDDGNSWPEAYWMLIDEFWGAGYSCITSIDNQTIGILYEGSQADLQFQQIKLKDILTPKHKIHSND